MKLPALFLAFTSLTYAQVDGSCWEVKSDLRKSKRYVCAAVNDSPFQVVVDQHRVLRQLKSTRPIPYALVLERGAEHNRKHGNSRLERFERNGLPLGGILGAAGVIGSGVVTAGVSAALPMVFPAVRKWFFEASSPLWEAAPQLLSDTEIVMEPGSSAGFWFYAEKGGMEGEFRILPMEMAVVERKLEFGRSASWSPGVVRNDGTGTLYYETGDRLHDYDSAGTDVYPTFNSTGIRIPAVQIRRISERRNESVFTPDHVTPTATPPTEFRYYLRTIAQNSK